MIATITLGFAAALAILPVLAHAITPVNDRNEWLMARARKRLERRVLELRDELKAAVTDARHVQTHVPTAFAPEGEQPCHD